MAIRKFPWRLFAQIVFVQNILVLSGIAGSGLAARHFFKQQVQEQAAGDLRLSLQSIAASLPSVANPAIWCDRFLHQELRVTVIKDDGSVLCDSQRDSATMDNHLNRPEVREAELSDFGHSVRYSSTLGQDFIYGALHLKSKKLVLRGAIPLSDLSGALRIFDRSLAFVFVTLIVILFGFSIWTGRALAQPIGRALRKAGEALEKSSQFSEKNESLSELAQLDASLEQIKKEMKRNSETLHREREEQAALISALSDAILAVDSEGAPLFYNSRLLLISGASAGPKNLWELFREPEILDSFQEVIKEGIGRLVPAIAIQVQSERRYFSLSVEPLLQDSVVFGAIGVFHDVTELKRADQIRIDFVANASHELRTPLTAIHGYTETLLDDVKNNRPIEIEFIEIIRRNSRRLMNLVQDLLDLSSLESGTDELQKNKIDTDEITKQILSQLNSVIIEKKIAIKQKINAKSVSADRRLLEQVLVNLIDNARKYSPIGAEIEISWLDDSDHIRLEISDSGPGIPQEHQARIFERFYRVDRARSRELGGTGLGLAIVKHIMQRHGGSVTVHSRLGEGATFQCRFPKSSY